MRDTGDVMVCVTGQRQCERLIMHGRDRCGGDRSLHVVHCAKTGQNFMNTPYEADAIEYLFTCAQVVGGQLSVLRADNVENALVEYAKHAGVGIIVMGASHDTATGADAQQENIAIRMQRQLPHVEFDII